VRDCATMNDGLLPSVVRVQAPSPEIEWGSRVITQAAGRSGAVLGENSSPVFRSGAAPRNIRAGCLIKIPPLHTAISSST
jgi:hypothetical protein